MASLGVDALVQIDALVQVDDVVVESAGFVEYNLDGLDFSQELAVEEYLLSAESLSAQDLLDAAVVRLTFYGLC